jgi:hypothetical protein
MTNFLDGRVIAHIIADLTGDDAGASALDMTQPTSLKENAGVSFQGSQKIGAFDIDGDLAREWLNSPNPHGKPNSDVLKPSWNGMDVTRRPRDGWIIDFGAAMSESEAALYEVPFLYSVENVKPERLKNNRETYRKNWWRHGEPRIAIRAATTNLQQYIATPEVAKAIKERTLTNLYNARAKGEVQWLDDAHRVLDAAVAAAYGWVDYLPEIADDEILRRLFALNLAPA